MNLTASDASLADKIIKGGLYFYKFQDLPLVEMAVCYGLLQLPKMPELRQADVSTFPTINNLDLNAIPYKDKQREKIRLQKLQVFKTTGNYNNILFSFLNIFVIYRSLARVKTLPAKTNRILVKSEITKSGTQREEGKKKIIEIR